MSLVRVHNFSISLDGFGAGEPQTLETPMGHAGDRLHEWMFGTSFWDPDGGERGVNDALARQHEPGIGAEIMGSRKWGYPGWHEDPDWKGWWGDDPPFHSPVFVLTHHTRPPIEQGDTTFHFLDAPPVDAVAAASEAAGGRDIRLGGGAATIREFIGAGLVDYMHVVVVPIVLGHGTRLWDDLEGLEKDFRIESIQSPSGVTHLVFTRTSGR